MRNSPWHQIPERQPQRATSHAYRVNSSSKCPVATLARRLGCRVSVSVLCGKFNVGTRHYRSQRCKGGGDATGGSSNSHIVQWGVSVVIRDIAHSANTLQRLYRSGIALKCSPVHRRATIHVLHPGVATQRHQDLYELVVVTERREMKECAPVVVY